MCAARLGLAWRAARHAMQGPEPVINTHCLPGSACLGPHLTPTPTHWREDLKLVCSPSRLPACLPAMSHRELAMHACMMGAPLSASRNIYGVGGLNCLSVCMDQPTIVEHN